MNNASSSASSFLFRRACEANAGKSVSAAQERATAHGILSLTHLVILVKAAVVGTVNVPQLFYCDAG